jgi:hypothetical protein
MSLDTFKKICRPTVIAVVIAILAVLVSCSAVPAEPESEAVTDIVESEASTEKVIEIITETDKKIVSDNALDKVPAFDFGGANVIIVNTYEHTVLPEDTGRLISKKHYERMNMLEEKHNFTFVRRLVSDNEAFTSARDAYNADLYYADLMYVSPSELWRYENAGMAINIKTLPFVDLNAEYYDKASTDAATVNGYVYGAIGAANTDFDNLPGVFFNKELLGETDIYSEVYNGSFTLERMTELSKNAAYDINGTRTGINGIVTDFTANRLVDNIYYSANGLNIDKDGDLLPSYNTFDDAAQECVDQIYRLMFDGNGYLRSNNARNLFENGSSLFCVTTLSEKYALAESNFNWGILPLPTFDGGTDYRTLKNEDFPITVVLSNTPDTTRSGILLESINAAMYGYISEEYYNECMYEIVRDNDTLNMIGIIEENAKCDFAYMFGGGINRLGECTYGAVRNSVTTARNLEYYNNRGQNINALIADRFDD